MARDEYTDYSCSTSVERLARDVETRLRAWHLMGSDRHVSFCSAEPTTTATTSCVRSTTTTIRPSSSLPVGDAKENANVQTTKGAEEVGTEKRASSDSRGSSRRQQPGARAQSAPLLDRGTRTTASVRLIRSESIAWNVSCSDTKDHAVQLRLALWDGPSQKTNTASTLPLSMCRLPFSRIPSDIFGDFSTLFGIGQHVTLTLDTEADQDLERHWISLASAILDRHDHRSAPWTLTSLLSSLLQTALNTAIANCQSRMPVFGWWGVYSPHSSTNPQQQDSAYLQLFPPWMTSKASADRIVDTANTQRRQQRLSSFFRKSSQRKNHGPKSSPVVNRHYIPPVMAAKLSLDDERDANFWVSIMPGRNLAADSRLTVWGQMLLRHCPRSTTSVALCGARHVYTYLKPKESLFPNRHKPRIQCDATEDDWRQVVETSDETRDSVEMYRLHCCRYALDILEQAVGATPAEPLWGPPDDPVASVHCTVTWNGRQGEEEEDKTEPLLSLPLRIRSNNAMSRQDWIDMEDSVERTLLDPMVSSSFEVRIHWDKETSVTSLAANQRCILAALIRTATLPQSILLQHLTNESILDEWSSNIDGQAASRVMDSAAVGELTRRIVDAMDWTSIGDHMIDPWEAEKIIQKVFDGTVTHGFPTPLSQLFESTDCSFDSPFSTLLKSAPAGRLLSMLCMFMSRLRGPSSMAVVWTRFIHELRAHWDCRESLPNMTHVPGLDPPPEAVATKRCVSSIGVQAEYSSFVHSSEPNPDDSYCLIGQKLQVFNVGVECALAADLLGSDKIRKLEEDGTRTRLANEQAEAGDVASTEIRNNATRCERVQRTEEKTGSATYDKTAQMDEGSGPLRKRQDLRSTPPDSCFNAVLEERSLDESQTSGSSKQEFFDAFGEGDSSLDLTTTDFDASILAAEHTAHASSPLSRHGARCPVQGVNLELSGDQLYAPYLQRPFPLTDDIVLERRLMLSGGHDSDGTIAGIQEQIEISQRLQKPKLLSDMCAFKAANPGATFNDFISWYGNPGSPLDDYSDGLYSDPTASPRTVRQSISRKLDNASQAMNVLNATRDFWTVTWDEARPCQATEQDPLFDASTMVEMAIDAFETMHPANLLNQILAVNLSSSYFVLLAAAGDAMDVGVVKIVLGRLREVTEVALKLLSRDATLGSVMAAHEGAGQSGERLPRHASVETIRACDEVCDAMGTAEAAICRATTLLGKFPKQYDVVQHILRRSENDPVMLSNAQGRNGILRAIQRQQGRTIDGLPLPSLREYVLRNTDEESPCQLCVRFGDEGAFQGIDAKGGVLACLTRCDRDDWQ